MQAAMGWTNSHLYDFAPATWMGFAISHWGDGPLDARKAKLTDVLEDAGTKTLRYLYDFGDGWEHTIKIDACRPSPASSIHGSSTPPGRCPPEDVGGPWGYAEMFEALEDPTTSATPKCSSGWAMSLIRTPSTPSRSSRRRSARKMLVEESPPQRSRDPPKPRPSPEG